MSTLTTTSTPTGAAAHARTFAYLSAAVYLGAGLIGFLVTGFESFATASDARVVILAVNPLHNIVHLTLGGAYLAGALAGRARQVDLLVGVGLLAAFALGIAGGAGFLNISGLAEPDNWLHLGWGAASVWIARRGA